MTIMRDGSTVDDPRLGRLPQPDERNRLYPIRSLIGEKPLRSYTWSVPIRLNQGNEGSCVGHGWAHELAARPVTVPNVDHEMARRIYFDAQRIDPWEGGAYPGAQPFYEGTSVLAAVKVLTQQGHYSAYHWAETERDIALAVGYRGPVVMGTDWLAGMMRPGLSGFISATGSNLGGHCWLIYSIDRLGNFYRMLNSWSSSWGRDGTAFISRADVAKLLADGGEACLPTRTKVKP